MAKGRGGSAGPAGPVGAAGAAGRRGEEEQVDVEFPVYGPLGKRISIVQRMTLDGKGRTKRVDVIFNDKQHTSENGGSGGDRPGSVVAPTANPLVLLRRLAFTKEADGRKLKVAEARGQVDKWAANSGLGQKNTRLLNGVLARRQAFVERWKADGGPRRFAARLLLKPEWRIVTGLGLQYGELESGLAMHGTYGWPVIPSSTLKGVAAEGARIVAADVEESGETERLPDLEERVRRVLGDPRPGASPAADGEGPQGKGSVTFLDALPGPGGVRVFDDVITPHQQPYYTDTMAGDGGRKDPRPPAEHHNPVPVPFLSVSGAFHVDLLGTDEEELRTVVEWLTRAGDESGVGGRTTAGYGYFTCEEFTGTPAAPHAGAPDGWTVTGTGSVPGGGKKGRKKGDKR